MIETVERGLGYFLQRVRVEPDVRASRFHGFRIIELLPAEWWEGVDLRPGDIVTRVNGMPIERPKQAHAAFESLRTADALRVSYVRGGEERELVYDIVDKDERAAGKRRTPSKAKKESVRAPVPPKRAPTPGSTPAPSAPEKPAPEEAAPEKSAPEKPAPVKPAPVKPEREKQKAPRVTPAE